jgi:hypothetical protein
MGRGGKPGQLIKQADGESNQRRNSQTGKACDTAAAHPLKAGGKKEITFELPRRSSLGLLVVYEEKIRHDRIKKLRQQAKELGMQVVELQKAA